MQCASRHHVGNFFSLRGTTESKLNKVDILKRLAESSCNESSHELQSRCWDAAEEIRAIRKNVCKRMSENY